MKKRFFIHPSLLNSEFSLDEIVFPPRKVPSFEVSQVSITTKLTKRTTLNTPILSSPMDTVTEHRMATLMAIMGGIGVIHYNFPSIEAQMSHVEKTRRFEAGFITKPIVLGKDVLVSDVYKAAEVNGFYTYPITEDGTLNSRLIGIVTRRDIRYCEDPKTPVSKLMTPKERLVVAHRKDTLDKNDINQANKILRKHNLDSLPIVDNDFKIIALVTDSDLRKNENHPNATKDDNKQLKVFVAVESRLSQAKERITQAAQLKVSGIVVDARNIFEDHIEIAKFTKKEFPQLDVILGNLVTVDVLHQVMKEAGKYIDAFRVGIGTGEICTTTESLGLGRNMGSSLFQLAQALKPYKKKFGQIGLIADGGIKSPHHIVGALTLGADAVMMGSELAGLDESPYEAYWDDDKAMTVKKVRGMGSAAAIAQRAGSNRYMLGQELADRFPEGIEKTIPYKGSGQKYLPKLITGIKQAMHGLGFKDIRELQEEGYIVPWRRAASKGSI